MLPLPAIVVAATHPLVLGCFSLGPDFQEPEWEGPAAWSGNAMVTSPLPNGAPWWTVFGDPVLDDLEAELAYVESNFQRMDAALKKNAVSLDEHSSARASAEKARASLAIARKALGDTVLKAPRSGGFFEASRQGNGKWPMN